MPRPQLSERETRERARVGATLRAFRECRGIAPDALANALGHSRAYLLNIEAGRKPITARLLPMFAEQLRVPVLAIAHPDDYTGGGE